MNDWDNKPAIPRIPNPRKPTDDRVQCTGCPDTVPRNQITERSGWALCIDCATERAHAEDRNLTRDLTYAL